MDITLQLKRYGYGLPGRRELEQQLPMEWPWLSREAERNGESVRRLVGRMMLDYLRAHPGDRNESAAWLRLHALRHQMRAAGWRNPEESDLYQHLPEDDAAWLVVAGPEPGTRIVAAATRAAACIVARTSPIRGTQYRYPPHLVYRRILAVYALDRPETLQIRVERSKIAPDPVSDSARGAPAALVDHYIAIGQMLLDDFPEPDGSDSSSSRSSSPDSTVS